MTAQSAIVAAFPQRLDVPRRDWVAAFGALKRLLADKDATEEVFEIMRALNGASTRNGYYKLLSTLEGGQLAFRTENLAAKLGDRAWLATLPPGSLGAVYRDFTDDGGVTPEGLIAVSNQVMNSIEHPVAWFGRRIRDSHDLWHVVTGYGLDSLGEACLVAFSYPQTRALGWAFIALGAAAKTRKAPTRQPYVAAIREGYVRGRAAAWLPGIDWVALLPQPLEAVQAQLGLAPPATYISIPVEQRGNAVPKG